MVFGIPSSDFEPPLYIQKDHMFRTFGKLFHSQMVQADPWQFTATGDWLRQHKYQQNSIIL